MSAENIIVRVLDTDRNNIEMWVSDKYIGYVDSETLSDNFNNTDENNGAENKESQVLIATYWINRLGKYDLRTIAYTSESAA